MALTKARYSDKAWRTPTWPEKLPLANTLRAVYGFEADELTIRFPDTPKRDIVVVYIATPETNYAALMVYQPTGEVIGVQTDYLENFAQFEHPAWQAALTERPSPEVASRIVRDIKDLFDRYGIETGDDEQT
jgi:hypothetical protein